MHFFPSARLCRALAIVALALSASARAEDLPSYRLPLFNGTDLTGWHVTDCDVAVEDGNLVLKAGDGFVRTDHRYADFILELDWRAAKASDYDSGIYLRSELPADRKKRPWPTRYQANLKQGLEGNLVGVKGAESTGLIKTGEWNHFKFTAIGHQLALEINGQPAWKTDTIEPLSGYIGFQSEVKLGGEFAFKNIQVTELGAISLFNGKDLSGWEGAETDASACWKVEDGLLLCDGKPGPWLRSEQEYGDFTLRLEYRVKEGGNSGVYVHVPANGKHRGREVDGDGPNGTEIQILDDRSDRYKDIQPYQFCGSVYAIAPSTEHVGRPAGEWNALEITCVGTSYRITHNGVQIVNASEAEFPELKNRQVRGYLGLQNHSEHVWFRNMRIGPPVK
ncbi:MAG: DUF1080 domain-containing protein [Pirellulales bacterium]